MSETPLKIMMFPWFAMGHLTTFLHISNKFAQRGHRIFFIVPKRSITRLRHLNLYPDFIKFIPLTVPQVEGLPHGTELTADVPFPMYPLLRRAMDLTRNEVEILIEEFRPRLVFFDFSHWLPESARRFGAKSICYCTISAAAVGWLFRDLTATVGELMGPPPGFPSRMKLSNHEAQVIHRINNKEEVNVDELKFVKRLTIATEECDAMVFKSCTEMEGEYMDFLAKKYTKPVFSAGPVLPEAAELDEKWSDWMNQFKSESVIYCSFGSEARLEMIQFQELILGLELTGKPFLVAVKPPIGVETIEEAIPNGFSGRGVVHGGWVQQQGILSHPNTGCFITHCGWGSLSEGILSECRLVLMPLVGDQFINARLISGELGIGIEVEKGDGDGIFRRERVKKAVDLAMEFGSEIGDKIRANHGKWRELLMRKGLDGSYIDELIIKLNALINN